MSKDDYGEVIRFSELSWFHSIDKQTKFAEQWKEVHWMVNLMRVEEYLNQKCEPRGRNKWKNNLVMNSGIWTVGKQYPFVIGSQK